jgi:hypothetical protein
MWQRGGGKCTAEGDGHVIYLRGGALPMYKGNTVLCRFGWHMARIAPSPRRTQTPAKKSRVRRGAGPDSVAARIRTRALFPGIRVFLSATHATVSDPDDDKCETRLPRSTPSPSTQTTPPRNVDRTGVRNLFTT